jgi:hypothetical protein
MLRRKMAMTALWAGGTFALALAVAIPATSNAVDDSNSPGLVATILTPQLTVNGVELTVTQDTPTTQPSQAPGQIKFTVRAKNKTAALASGNFKIQLTTVSLASGRSRTLPMPTEYWTDSADIALPAGESKTFVFTPPPLLPGRVFTLNLQSSGNQVAMLSMTDKNTSPTTPHP